MKILSDVSQIVPNDWNKFYAKAGRNAPVAGIYCDESVDVGKATDHLVSLGVGMILGPVGSRERVQQVLSKAKNTAVLVPFDDSSSLPEGAVGCSRPRAKMAAATAAAVLDIVEYVKTVRGVASPRVVLASSALPGDDELHQKLAPLIPGVVEADVRVKVDLAGTAEFAPLEAVGSIFKGGDPDVVVLNVSWVSRNIIERAEAVRPGKVHWVVLRDAMDGLQSIGIAGGGFEGRSFGIDWSTASLDSQAAITQNAIEQRLFESKLDTSTNTVVRTMFDCAYSAFYAGIAAVNTKGVPTTAIGRDSYAAGLEFVSLSGALVPLTREQVGTGTALIAAGTKMLVSGATGPLKWDSRTGIRVDEASLAVSCFKDKKWMAAKKPEYPLSGGRNGTLECP